MLPDNLSSRGKMLSLNKKLKMFTILLLFATTLFSLNALGITVAGPLDMEYSHKWAHDAVNAYDIYAADVDSDGVVEIVTIGWIWDGSEYWAQLRIYSWDGSTFDVEINREFQVDGEWSIGESVCITDLGNDGHLEIIVTGFSIPMSGDLPAWIRVYRWDGSALALLDTRTWTGSNTYSYAVASGDLNNNGHNEVVSVGHHYDDVGDQYTELNVWSWN
ncbi:VCBS repeat-containing protein, partial [Candidatus Bathyarchaeota archaeon]|nr:VCBS repeat-containing protein [Candidatus Bathyarchaeota archaeon]